MAFLLKNLSAIPLDIATLDGPAILPANGQITANLSAFEIEVMHHSPDIEIINENALDHDGNGKPGGATNPEREDLKAQARELGIEHARNIPTEKLKELIDAKLAS